MRKILACAAALRGKKKKPRAGREQVFSSGGTYVRAKFGQPGAHSAAERQARRAERNAKAYERRQQKRAFEDHLATLSPAAQFTAWLETLSPEEQAQARAGKVHRHLSPHTRPPAGADDALDLAEYEPIPEADRRGTHNGRTVVAIGHEPLETLEPELATPDTLASAAADFAVALRWALDPPGPGETHDHHLVRLGKRSAALITLLHQPLAAGLPLDPLLARALLAAFREPSLPELLQRLQGVGRIYERYLEWMRRARDLAGLGERLQLVAYDLRPDLIDAATLATIGEATAKTRQATNKSANCLRDTFAGLKALTQRADITRLRCRLAQLGLRADPGLALA